MVELRLDSIQDVGMPQDCFVSVRIGDTQKLSRLSSSRVYRFPKAGDRRYGKVEVFRRIGACNVDVDTSNKDLRELSIDCTEAGFGTLGLRVAVEGEAKAEPAEPAQAPKEGAKVKAAKEYLSKHGLEVRLSEAMQAVLRERPADPAEFLASKLIETRDRAGGIKLPPLKAAPQPDTRDLRMPTEAQKAAAAKPRSLEPLLSKSSEPAAKPPAAQALVPFKDFYQANFGSMGSDGFARLHMKFPTKKPAKATVESLLPFKPYYAANFGGVGTDSLSKLHSRFPAATRPARAAAATVKAVLPFKPYYAANFGGVGTDSLSKLYSKFPAAKKPANAAAAATVKAVLPFKPYYAANFGGVGDGVYSKLYDSFPRKIPGPSPSPKAIEAAKEAPKAYLKPSVGTWLSKIPPSIKGAGTTAVGANTAAAGLAPEQPADFKRMPSVGTWLAPLPRRISKAESPGLAPQKANFAQKPSVATWLAKKPVVRQQPAAFQKRPSVGTWLGIHRGRAA